jgi:diguanylate cyclase
VSSRTGEAEPPDSPASAALECLLTQSEDIKEAVTQAADELVSVNEVLKQEPEGSAPARTLQNAIAQNVDVERKVAKAAEDLDRVNRLLAEEVAKQASLASELEDTKSWLARTRDDLAESRTQEKDARQEALRDSLTGIPNRASFDQALDHGLTQARRHDRKLAVFLIDIDDFKSINDSHGHALGDKVLLMVAERLQSSLREEDTVCRWGGDEFAALLPEVDQEADLLRLADKLVRRIAEECELEGAVLAVRASIGIALFPADGDTAEGLFKNADAAMFRAKGTVQRVVLFRESSATDT